MAKNIPKKFLDFDDNIDGQFTSEKNTMPDHLRLFQGSPPPTRGLHLKDPIILPFLF